MDENNNVSQLLPGTPTAGQLQAGTVTNINIVVAGALTAPAHLSGGPLTVPTTLGVRTVNGETGDVIITPENIGAATEQDFQDHINDQVIHITADERAVWNECLIGAVNADEGLTFWHARDVI